VRIPDEARGVVESDALAHITTIDPDGRPQTTLAWVGLEGDEVVLATLPDQRKLRNLRRDHGSRSRSRPTGSPRTGYTSTS